MVQSNFFYYPNESKIIRALSWNQPYAELMIHGKVETRRYPTYVRGKVLICSCKKGYNLNQVHNISGDKQIVRITQVLGRNNDHFLNNYRAGLAIAIGELTDCRRMLPHDEEKTFVKFNENLWCWFFENVKRIEPFEWKGKQGWSILNESLSTSINEKYYKVDQKLLEL